MATVEIPAIAEHSTNQQYRTNREKVGDAGISFKGNLRQLVAGEHPINQRIDNTSRAHDQRPPFQKKGSTLESDFQNGIIHSGDGSAENSAIFNGLKDVNSTLFIQREIAAYPGIQQPQQSQSEKPESADEEFGQSAQSPIDPLNFIASQFVLMPRTENLERFAKHQSPESKLPMPQITQLDDIQSAPVQQDKLDVSTKKMLVVPELIDNLEPNTADSADVDFRLLEAQFQKFHSFLDRQKIIVSDSVRPAAVELSALQNGSAVHTSVDKLSLKLSTGSDGHITCDIRRSDGSLDIVVEAGGLDYEQIRGRENELKRSLGAIGIVVDDVKLQMTRQTDRLDQGETAMGSENPRYSGGNGAGDAKHNERNTNNSMAEKQRSKYGTSTEIDAPVPHRSNDVYI